MYTAAFPCYRQLALRRGLAYGAYGYGFRFEGELYFDERVGARLLALMREQGGWGRLLN